MVWIRLISILALMHQMRFLSVSLTVKLLFHILCSWSLVCVCSNYPWYIVWVLQSSSLSNFYNVVSLWKWWTGHLLGPVSAHVRALSWKCPWKMACILNIGSLSNYYSAVSQWSVMIGTLVVCVRVCVGTFRKMVYASKKVCCPVTSVEFCFLLWCR